MPRLLIGLAATAALPLTFLVSAPVLAQAEIKGSEAQIVVPESQLAEEAPALHGLMDAIGIYDILAIMALEGTTGAAEMESNMFPGRGGAAWAAVVASIYSADRLVQDFDAALPRTMLDDAQLAELTAFFTSDTGQRIIAGEIAGRRAFLDPAVEADAAATVAEMASANDDRLGLLTEFIAANDLIERNVSGALNSNFAFYRGLADGGAFDTDMPEELMLAEVWGQEAEVRAETLEWLYSYQITAYADLSDDDLRAYIATSTSPMGQLLNGVLFAAFDVLFDDLTYELGVAAAGFIAGDET